MKKVININFQGRVTPIEEVAYEVLQQYTASLRNYFANEEGRDEIINDIEGRIAELFGEILQKGNPCITEANVQAVMNSIGRPEDFDGEETKVQSQLTNNQSANSGQQQQQDFGANGNRKLFRDENNKVLGGVCSGLANYFGIDPLIIRIIFVVALGVLFLPYIILWVAVPSSATKFIGAARKRLMRDPDNKIISGVCGGLAQYFGVNVWVPRVIFLIPFISIAFGWNHWGSFDFPNLLNLTFRPGITLVYIILWLVLPEAKTTSDKLEMKGEKVDLNSIKNSITEEMKGVGERVGKFGAEAGQVIGEKGAELGKDLSVAARRTGGGLGNVIATIVKIFAYFILAVILFAVVTSLFGIGIAVTGLLPLKGYLINDGWQTVYLWGTLLLFIWIPVIGIITWIIRRITKSKANSNVIRYTFGALWTLGWVCVIFLISSLSKEFSSRNNASEKEVYLSNPGVNNLVVKAGSLDNYYNSSRNWLHLEPFANIDEDTVFVRNVKLRIVKSETDSFSVKMVTLASGSSKENANRLASGIKYGINQKDTVLMLDKGIAITPKDKFRNQSIIITVAVPVGKRIMVEEDAAWWENVHVNIGVNDNDWDWHYDKDAQGWDNDVEYIMTKEGLKPLYAKDNDKYKYDGDNSDQTNDGTTEQLEQIEQQQRDIEQQRKNLEEEKKNLQNSLKKDSTRYKYKPATIEEVPKPVVKETRLLKIEKIKKAVVEAAVKAPNPLTNRFTM